ncbi:MAG: hypothetical protein JWM85_1536 [Acidimicrobiaceae bacterium]|nr:hypothetical protein [Acidimicrobiaceae bacterium]
MWAVAAALLGAFCVLIAAGALGGPHVHVGAVFAGIAAAVLLAMLAIGGTDPGLAWALLALDVAGSAVVGVSAYHGITRAPAASRKRSLVGAAGVAVGTMGPEGVVQVRGERWSATCLNGPVPSGAQIEVVGVNGIRLEVWHAEAGTLGLGEPSWPQSEGQGPEAEK